MANFCHLFPASFHTGEHKQKIESINENNVSEFLACEFSLKRVDEIYGKLWRVGYPRAPNSMSSQAVRGRTIVHTDSLDMHLVWNDGRIFVKPLPHYLLEPDIWAELLGKVGTEKTQADADRQAEIRSAALGFLYSYVCLLSDRVDFELAIREGLLPSDIDKSRWAEWRTFSAEILRPEVVHAVHRRFNYGELRLDRLNWIYIFKDIPRFNLYHNPWNTYTDVVVSNVAGITAITVYLVVLLTAMQVGLATNKLKDNKAFNGASYGFTIFAIFTPIVALVLGIMFLLVVVIQNWKSAQNAKLVLESASNHQNQAIEGGFTVGDAGGVGPAAHEEQLTYLGNGTEGLHSARNAHLRTQRSTSHRKELIV